MPSLKKIRSAEVEEKNRRKKPARQEEGKVMEAPGGEMALPSSMAGDPVALLTSPQMAHPANAPLRAQAVTELQRQRGNFYVQEIIERIRAEKGSGRPLEPQVQAEMEAAFGHDFGGVRVHTDSTADKLAKELGAKAFTFGKDIFFREGAYQPGSELGKGLLGHELTHVVQQGLGSSAIRIQRRAEGDITQMSITESWARELNDVELEEQINIVRDQLMTLDLTVPEYNVALRNLRILEEEAARRIPSKVPDLKAETVMEVEKKIKDGKKQEAINLILKEIKASKMPNLEKCDGKTMTYDSTIAGEGLTTCTYDPATNKALKIVVKIGDKAFSSVAWLYSSMMHEYQHVNQFLSNPKGVPANPAMSDFAAYTWEIHHAHETGVIKEPDKMKDLGKRLKMQGWDQMTKAEKKANKKTYDESIKIIREAIGDKSWKP
jgi:hypothetical protein